MAKARARKLDETDDDEKGNGGGDEAIAGIQLSLVTVRFRTDLVVSRENQDQYLGTYGANGQRASQPVSAINWGSKIRVDASPVDDRGKGVDPSEFLTEDGQPLIVWHYDWSDGLYTGSWRDNHDEDGDMMVESHNGETPFHLIDQGKKKFYASGGLSCMFRPDKSREDNDRHHVEIWCSIGDVESNRLWLTVS